MKYLRIQLTIIILGTLLFVKEDTNAIKPDNTTMKKVYFGILAGGDGKRLWPLSCKNQPKQLLPFIQNKCLLEETIDRVKPLALEKDSTFVITSKMYEDLIAQAVGGKIGFTITEPRGNNTGPAILLACYKLLAKDPEAIVVFLPADHYIPNADGFRDVMQSVITFLQHDSNVPVIATLGLKPTFPATGYGYIQAAVGDMQNKNYFKVIKFHEKPDKKVAQEYVKQATMFWNLGIFAGKVKTFIKEFQRCAPNFYESFKNYYEGRTDYSELESISIDHAVMEKSSNIVVFPVEFEWYDIGNIPTFLSLKKSDASAVQSVVTLEGTQNLIHSTKKVVVCIGVSDLCVVETDDVLLIVQKDKADLVKVIAEKMSAVFSGTKESENESAETGAFVDLEEGFKNG